MRSQILTVVGILSVILGAPLACNLPSAISTSISPIEMDVLVTFAAQTALATTLQPLPGTPPAFFTMTPSMLPPPPLATPTPILPSLYISSATNCRVGPGKIYDWVGGAETGTVVEAVARDPDGEYWYIRNPDEPSSFCWLWGYYATPSGNVWALPIFTAMPTPTASASYTISFSAVDGCVGWVLEFKVKNTGDVPLKSYSIAAKDKDTGESINISSNEFEERDGCVTVKSNSALSPGELGLVTSSDFSNDPTGHKINATITICTEDGLGGKCYSDTLNFKA